MKNINEHKKQALFDIWAFCDLIKFQGGMKEFDSFHIRMSEHYTDVLKPEFLKALSIDPEGFLHTPSTFVNIVPRGYLKSTVNTVLYALWRIYRNPNIRINIDTNNQPLAYSFIRQLRSYLEDTELVDKVWDARVHIPGKLIPNLKVTRLARGASSDDTESVDNKIIWNNVALQVIRTKKLKEPTVAIGSANSINTGNHYDLVIFDDVVDYSNSNTLDKREKLKRWVNEVESQLDPCAVVNVEGSIFPLQDIVGLKMINGTPYYDEDLYSQFIKRSNESPRVSVFYENIYVNGKDDSEGYNWHKRFNKATIADIRERIDDPKVFAAQYELKTLEQYNADTEEKRNIITSSSKPSIDLHRKTMEFEYEGTIYNVPIFGAMDVAHKHDFNVLILGAYLKPDLFLCVDTLVQRGNLEKFLKEAYHLVQEVFPVQVCYVEANGVGGGAKTALSYIHQLRNQHGFKPLKFTEIWQTESKAVRIAFAMRYLQDHKVVCTGNIAHNSEFVKQLKSYTEYDDVPDCLATALYRFPKNVWRTARVEEKRQVFQATSEQKVAAKLRNIYELMNNEKPNTLRSVVSGHY
jgi:hypothetical protein